MKHYIRRRQLFKRILKKTDMEIDGHRADHGSAQQALRETERRLDETQSLIFEAETNLRLWAEGRSNLPLESIGSINGFIAEKKQQRQQQVLEKRQVESIAEGITRHLKEKTLLRKGYSNIFLRNEKDIQSFLDKTLQHENETVWVSHKEAGVE